MGLAAVTFKRAIIGFHQDEHDDWVADLACGHTQHVRHRPPWQLRPWVTSIEGRARHLGQTLVCKKCMENIPPPPDRYRAIFNAIKLSTSGHSRRLIWLRPQRAKVSTQGAHYIPGLG
ncbi:MAG: DUF3565 domain-containing protein [Gammaproteobacteria bacterium]|nr:DUF3565 domain-containing protein [Gammaproteobacteria bacterium]